MKIKQDIHSETEQSCVYIYLMILMTLILILILFPTVKSTVIFTDILLIICLNPVYIFNMK